MTFDSLCAPRYTPELDIIVRELDVLSHRLVAAAQEARGLAAGTDWHARAALVFHEKAERWAGSVSSLGCLAESARFEAVEARAIARARLEMSCA